MKSTSFIYEKENGYQKEKTMNDYWPILVINECGWFDGAIDEILVKNGYTVINCTTVPKGTPLIKQHQPDMVIILCKPDSEVSPAYRHRYRLLGDLPVIVISPNYKVGELDRWLRAGFEDYLPSDLDINDLLWRIEFNLHKFYSKNMRVLEYGDLKLDTKWRMGFRGDRKFRLRCLEYFLLKFFMQNPEKIHSKRVIIDAVWGSDQDVKSITLDVMIHDLRKKIAQGRETQLIYTIDRGGYVLKANE